MAEFEYAFFGAMDGGYPYLANGSTAAITNDQNNFYLDSGKTAGYEDMELTDLSEFSSLENSHSILGIEVIITKAGYIGTNGNSTFDIEIYNKNSSSWSDTITTTLTNNYEAHPEDNIVGGSSVLWGKTWSKEDFDASEFQVHFDNPTEPSGVSIALAGLFIYLKIYYEGDLKGFSNKITSGLIQLTSGKITIP